MAPIVWSRKWLNLELPVISFSIHQYMQWDIVPIWLGKFLCMFIHMQFVSVHLLFMIGVLFTRTLCLVIFFNKIVRGKDIASSLYDWYALSLDWLTHMSIDIVAHQSMVVLCTVLLNVLLLNWFLLVLFWSSQPMHLTCIIDKIPTSIVIPRCSQPTFCTTRTQIYVTYSKPLT